MGDGKQDMTDDAVIERVATTIYREFENRPLYARAQMNGIMATELARAAIAAYEKAKNEKAS